MSESSNRSVGFASLSSLFQRDDQDHNNNASFRRGTSRDSAAHLSHAQLPQFMEGMSATNPYTDERLVFQGGKWKRDDFAVGKTPGEGQRAFADHPSMGMRLPNGFVVGPPAQKPTQAGGLVLKRLPPSPSLSFDDEVARYDALQKRTLGKAASMDPVTGLNVDDGLAAGTTVVLTPRMQREILSMEAQPSYKVPDPQAWGPDGKRIYGRSEAFMHGVGDGIVDNIAGTIAVQDMANSGRDIGAARAYGPARAKVRAIMDEARQQQPGAYVGGQTTTALATLLMGGAPLRAATTTDGALAGMRSGIVPGVIGGVSQADGLEDAIVKGINGATFGATVGGLSRAAARGVDAASLAARGRHAAPWVGNAVRRTGDVLINVGSGEPPDLLRLFPQKSGGYLRY
jgi:hypothetical protein